MLCERVTCAVNTGADAITAALDLSDRDTDVVNLIVNAIITCIDHPDANFDDIVTTNYSETPDQVRAWWDW